MRGLDVALGAVVEQRPGRLDRGRGVGEVVGEDLVGVDVAGGGEVLEGMLDDRAGGLDCRRGCGEVGLLYGPGGGGISFL